MPPLKSILINRPLPNNRLECRVCKQRFWMTCKYLDHMSTHKHFLLTCNICNKDFYNRKHLDEHYLTHKEVTNTYDCSQCPRKFLQKYQLQQHMEFHTVPVINKPTVKKKKNVHFNTFPESRKIDDDFSDDEDLFEDYKPSNKITQTRSGRIVKAKKMFEEEPEKKRRRKNSEVCAENTEQSLVFKTVNKINADIGKPSVTSSSPANSSVPSKKVSDQKLVVVTEKIPDHVYKKYIEKGNVCTYETSKNEESTSNSKAICLNGRLNQNENKVSINTVIEKPFLCLSPSQINLPTSPRVDKQFLYVGPKQDINKIKTIVEEMKAMSTANIINTENKLSAKTNIVESSHKSPQKTGNLNTGNLNVSTDTVTLPLTSNNADNEGNSASDKLEGKSNENDLNEVEAEDGILQKTVVQDFIFIKVTPELMQKMQRKTLRSQQAKLQNVESCMPVKPGSVSLNLLPSASGLNKDSNEVLPMSKITEKNKAVEIKNYSVGQLSPKVPATSDTNFTNQAMKPITSETNASDQAIKLNVNQNVKSIQTASVNKVISENAMTNVSNQPVKPNVNQNRKSIQTASISKVILERSKNEKTLEQRIELNNLHADKSSQIASSQSEVFSILSKNEKLLERYRAKIDEKERKKKEKYEFKKKMRYMEKLLHIKDPNIAVSTKKRSKFPNTAVSSSDKKGSLKVKETDDKDKSSKLVKNRTKNTDVAYRSNKKLHTVEKTCKLDPITVESSTKSNTCGDSFSNCAVHTSSHSVNYSAAKSQSQRQNLKFKQLETAEEKAIKKAYDISLKFEKTISEKECLKLLDELDNLITDFNISDRCPFLFTITRFCKLYVESYKVKERAISLHTKITKSLT